MHVAICVVTYRRPRWLTECLNGLSQLLLDEEKHQVTVVVVDNDREEASRAIIEDMQPGFRWHLTYEVEPEQGVSFARNRAVRAALAEAPDFVAFLDDDEVADQHWLEQLLAAQERYGADVVSGPVVPIYEPGVADWVVRGRLFERPRHASGTRVNSAITANCLIAAGLLAGAPEPFHPAFAIAGGGDTHFFRRIHQEGASIVWADSAVVCEHVPRSRATARWLLQRAYRGGTSFALCERLHHSTPGWMLVRVSTGIARSLVGVLFLGPSLLLGKARTIRTLQTLCVGLGLVAGTLGFAYREYTVVHGE